MEDSNKKIKKKYWAIGSKEGEKLEFLPIFEANEETGEIETKYLQLSFKDKKGTDHKYTFNWLDIYMFIYFASNEELRKQLASRYERQVSYIPYDVTIQITPQEKESGIAHRRVELPVDELQMAIARNEAYKMFMRSKNKDPRAFLYQQKRKS